MVSVLLCLTYFTQREKDAYLQSESRSVQKWRVSIVSGKSDFMSVESPN